MSADRSVDAEEVGRRMRALYEALRRPGDHSVTLQRYEQLLDELHPAESVDENEEGSWGWWAQRILTP